MFCMLVCLKKLLTEHSKTFKHIENINLLVFIRFIRIWRGIRKSLAFPAEQSIWSQDNQRHEVFCFSLKIFIHELLWGLHDWFGSLGMDYGRYGRWPPLPPSIPRLPNQSFSPHNNSFIKDFQTSSKYFVPLVILLSNLLLSRERATLSDPTSNPFSADKTKRYISFSLLQFSYFFLI